MPRNRVIERGPNVKAYRQRRPTPSYCKVGFNLKISMYFERPDGSLLADKTIVWEEKQLVPTFEFGKERHRKRVADRLVEAGFNVHSRATIESRLETVFWWARTVVEENLARRGVFEDRTLTIEVGAEKFVRFSSEESDEDIEVAVALERSMLLQQLAAAPKTAPATKESVRLLKKVILVDECGEEEDCMICMEPLCSNKRSRMVVTAMPCSHLFHGGCIKRWLNTYHTCPLCRFTMPTAKH